MERRRGLAVAALAMLALVAVGLLVADEFGGSEREPAAEGLAVALGPDASEPAQPAAPPSSPGGERPAAQPDGSQEQGRDPAPLTAAPLHEIVSVRLGRRVALRESPGGPVVTVLKDRTEFGSIRKHWVVHRKRGWLGVPAAEIPDGRLGWIRDDPAKLEYEATPYRIEADLSAREVVLRRGRTVVRRIAVTVGAPGSPTPPGRYAVTDGLVVKGSRDSYGCCILALTGHQPNLPPGWIGGDRIAIHGTPGTVGSAASSGCLRARDADVRALFRAIPLGTPVRIRR